MKVFSDLHHSGLFYSLKLLFEDKLGGEIYRPIGMDWFYKDFWHIAEPYNNNIETVQQYLQIKPEHIPADGTVPLNRVIAEEATHYQVEELAHNYTQKCLTVKQFADMDIDIIIASIPRHYSVYKKLRDTYHPTAKVVCQMGNMFNEVHELLSNGTIQNFMSSTIPITVPTEVRSIFYHQAIALDVFKPLEIQHVNSVTSFVNLLPKSELYNELRGLLSNYTFRAYGSGCPDGTIHNIKDIARIMQQSGFGYHYKPYCDGFGHVIFDWFAVGRPVIANVREYKNYLAGELMQEGINCIALDNGDSTQVIADKIREASQIDKYSSMCKASRAAFQQCVDYEAELVNLKAFFDTLI